jgi:hypothetical protein
MHPTPLALVQTQQRPSRSKNLVRKSQDFRTRLLVAGSRSFGRNLGSSLGDLKVNGVGEDVLIWAIWHDVMVDTPVSQSAIQHNPVPLLIFQSKLQGRQGCTIKDIVVLLTISWSHRPQ